MIVGIFIGPIQTKIPLFRIDKDLFRAIRPTTDVDRLASSVCGRRIRKRWVNYILHTNMLPWPQHHGWSLTSL